MKQVAGRLKLEMAQYRELAAFSQFGSDLDQATQKQIARGQRLTEVLKQEQYQPMLVEQQVAILYAAVNNHLDNVPVNKIKEFEKGFLRFLSAGYEKTLAKIKQEKELKPETEEQLKKAISEYKESLDYLIK
jgi:F-type H+-transporting ATPase subunit alpha